MALIAVAREIHVKMVAMIEVVVGAKHGGEALAGSLMHHPQEVAFGRSAIPPALDADGAPIGKLETRDIDGVGVAVLRQPRAYNMVLRPAAI